ncbi:succinyl-diaminopimelate desuccinylase [Arenimonas caeni]|uniref:Succinyl-diaminopimelate desuccinylase n=1 Tax=Arenimonas caeni TaxID=2058085 RepID=A0A2P6M9U7_9GAMM|nr:succinyl-diaminopimelate desuccinylase [Arenimonas caeni]MDY0022506.1 succinyl-diaminopimelate desuccinylase [Arenimonas caeni]PRH82755.1 succinyl-diaminopimelate desuccinylase [Arenimonas caeni]
MSEVLALARALIARPSVTPDDAGCQDLVAARLARAGFRVEWFDHGAVRNLWATHGEGGEVLCLLGHTDVVPPGPREAWDSDPFEPTERDGHLYGRGAADMKGSVAAFVVAAEQFVAAHPDHPGTLAILLTSDEEGDAIDGVRKVADRFKAEGRPIHYCITGEPSSKEALGDLLRVGRRGTLSGVLRVKGIQGHVAYPEKARNPIHQAMPALAELCARAWDEGYPEFPPSSFQVSNIHAGTGANNVIPGHCEVVFNFRFNPGWQAAQLEAEVEAVLARHGLEYDLLWHRGGEPFLTGEGRLRAAAREVIREQLGLVPEENTGGGTSDARFIAPLGAEVVELGPINSSIHKVNERVALAELERLPALYRAIAERLLLS